MGGVMAVVMVIDDDAMNRELLETVLTRAGYDVISANSGEMALERIEAVAPSVVLCDVRMTGIDGFETCEQIKHNPATAHIPVFIFSALESAEERQRAQRVGATDYVSKMKGWQVLVEHVKAAVG